MKNLYNLLKEVEKEFNYERKIAEDKKIREDMKKMANQLKIMKEEMKKAGFSEEFVEEMIIEAIRANKEV